MWRMAVAAACGMIALAAAAQQPPPPPRAAQTGNAGMSALQDRSSHSPAEALFVQRCGMCHRNFGMGTFLLARRVDPARAWLEKRDDLTAEFVVSAARAGIGNMPRITRGDVDDAELAKIAAYLGKGK